MSAALRLLRAHWLLAALLAGGAALRVVALLAYRPALLYFDSFSYLANVTQLDPDGLRPVGYSVILRFLLPLGGLQAVTLVQHLLGLGMAVAIYGLLLRHGARRWLAALASAPVLLDGYQLQIEHLVMSDVWFQALLLGIVWLLTPRGGVTPPVAAVVGALVGVAGVVRLVGLPLLLPALVFVLLAAAPAGTPHPWRRPALRAVAMTVGFAVVLAGYAGYYRAATDGWGLSGGGGMAYGRAAVIADCAQLAPASPERAICPTLPREQRYGVDYYTHNPDSPPETVELAPGVSMSRTQAEFVRQVFTNQPVDLAAAVAVDFGKGFRALRTDAADDVPVARWRFQPEYPFYEPPVRVRATAEAYGDVPIAADQSLAGFLRGYQLSVGYTPGPVLLLALLVGLTGGLTRGRAGDAGLRGPALLTTGLAVTVLGAAAAFEFSWRYQWPGLVLLPIAGVLGVTALSGRPRGSGEATGLAPYPDETDRAAHARFSRDERAFLGPVVVVIAAYDEQDGIGAVLDAVPGECAGLRVDTLVVVDGATDDTATVARRHGARVCDVPANRGQGAALRLGYGLARAGGAEYIVTTDADGQYDLGELERLLVPLIADEADFVTGSRQLGRSETTDPVRHLGVRVFAALAAMLTGQRLSDTSFGFRAMRAEITAQVALREPQYQAAELLLGALACGYRVTEVPTTMRARIAGTTKKGGNLGYGLRYARVLVGTWWRCRGSARPAKTSRSSSTNLTTNKHP